MPDEERDDFSDDGNDAGHLIIPNAFVDTSMRRAKAVLERVSNTLLPGGSMLSPVKDVCDMLTTMSINLVRGGSALQDLMEEVAAEWEYKGIQTDSIDPCYFTDPGANNIKVRGPDYLKDRKKILAEDPVCRLSSANLLEVAPTFHIARYLPSIHESTAPFTFVLQIMVPGKTNISLTFGWSAAYDPIAAAEQEGIGTQSVPCSPAHRYADSAASDSFTGGDMLERRPSRSQPGTPSTRGSIDLRSCTPFDRCLSRFVAGEEDLEVDVKRRHNTFKLIPRIDKGSWMIRNAVGSTPVLLGKKLTTKYFRGPRYFEVDIDVGSSSTAAATVGMVQGALKGLCIDMAVVLEGHTQDELPEALVGSVRLNHLDLEKAAKLDLQTGIITRK
eukprot:jgi/Astpho2/7511/Aster-02077